MLLQEMKQTWGSEYKKKLFLKNLRSWLKMQEVLVRKEVERGGGLLSKEVSMPAL